MDGGVAEIGGFIDGGAGADGALELAFEAGIEGGPSDASWWDGAPEDGEVSDSGPVDGGLYASASADAGGAPSLAQAKPVETPTAPSAPTYIPIPIPGPSESVERPVRDLLEQFFPVLPREQTTILAPALMLIVLMALAFALRRAGEWLPDQGLLPRLAALALVLTRLLIIVGVVGLIAKLMPEWMGRALPWIVLAAAGAVGWSARDLLPDAVAWLVLASERRIGVGLWIAGEGFEGVVERRGFRSVVVRDAHGLRVAIPNRLLLQTPVTVQGQRGPIHDVVLRLRVDRPSALVREALNDAILTSPWIALGRPLLIRRDGREADLWHIRVHLLEIRFALRFEGELLERTEEMLAAPDRATPIAASRSDEDGTSVG